MTNLRDRLQTSLGSIYTVEDELGGGGMSRVFVATETALQRHVVLKVLPPDLGAGASIERFRHEIQLAASLQHPHIVPIHAAGEADGLLYYTMPFVAGESLRARLGREGELPIADGIRILRDVADALGHAHGRGVVHRDIKPDNVLLADHHAVVTDFGVAKALSAAQTGERLTDVGLALGTPLYMAPEQGSADPHVDHRADIYSFGVMAYEMLAGEPPFSAPSSRGLVAAHISATPPPIREKRPAVPPTLADLVMRCLEKRPADRPQSAAEIARLLDSLISTGVGSLTPQPFVPLRRRFPRKILAAIAAILLTGAGLTAVLIASRSDPTADPSLVVVLPFRTTAAEPALQYLREGMLDLISAKLAGNVRTTDTRAALRAWREAGGSPSSDLTEAEAAQVARSLGAGRALHGDVLGYGSNLVINATLIRSTGTGTARARVEGDAAHLALLVDSLVAKLFAQDAGSDQEQVRLLAGTPLNALQAYLAGEAEYRSGRYGEAKEHFVRAIDADTTFALAGMRLFQAGAWGGHPRRVDGARIAFANVAKLAPRHRVLLEATAHPDRPLSCVEERTHEERALATVTDSPELWAAYGDILFHCGDVMNERDVHRRSLEAFDRALALDSSFTPALEHVPLLHAFLGDTSSALRAYALLRKRAADMALVWGAVLARDSAERRRVIDTALESSGPDPVMLAHTLMLEGFMHEAEDVQHEARARAVTEADRVRALAQAVRLALDRGRPKEALEFHAEHNSHPSLYVLDALVADGDSLAAVRALPALRQLLSAPPPATADISSDWMRSVYGVAAWDLQLGSTVSAQRALQLFGAAAPSEDTGRAANIVRAVTLLIEAQVAHVERREDARAVLEAADSLVRQGAFPVLETYAWVPLVRIWEERGDPIRAYRAASRIRYETNPRAVARQIYHRARLAALTGDREVAIFYYRRYLAMRSDPEPQLRPQRDSARAEFSRLERGRRR